MRFIVIEGLDGSGKSTQIKLLLKHLKGKNIPYQFLHFPRTESPIYGELIARFLRGEFGEMSTVHPYLVALIFAGDRNEAQHTIKKWLDEGYFVLLDRYVNSNIAYQCAKLESAPDRDKLSKWIRHLEYEYNQIPQPDKSIFLDVPFGFTQEKLTNDRMGNDRDYLNGKQDIHEDDLDFQQKVREVYLELCAEDSNFVKIDCFKENHEMLAPDEIFARIRNVLNLT
ncbi:MAG: dTMP kinase [Bacteroidales bacterium]|nr:dTMP kinase [Bacteroidales bacterium]